MQPFRPAVIFSVLLFAASLCHASDDPPMRIWGYYPSWLQEEWKKIDLGLYDRVFFFDAPFDSSGNVEIPEDLKALAAAKPGLQLTLSQFDKNSFETLFSHPELRERLLRNTLSATENLSGVQFDVEIPQRVSRESASGFKTFMKMLKAELDGKNKSLTLFVLADDDAGIYDRDLLSIFDHVVLQGYDAHWKTGPEAGPIAPIGGSNPDCWEATLARYAALGLPHEKIVISVPFFGYEWPTVSDRPESPTRGEGSVISYAPLPPGLVPEVKVSALERVKRFGSKRDVETGAPYYAFRDSEGWVQGWFEDGKSLERKFAFVRKEHLAGIAVFPIGYDGGIFEKLLKAFFR